MAPGVAASKTKKEFFTHLGLQEGSEEDERLFRKMLDEAAAGRQRISQSAENLNLQYRHDPDVQPPYTYNQITETARHREILTIYRNSCPETRAYYNRGQFFEGPNEENWIIRWCLYHSFRYTDNRNRTRSRGRKLMSITSNSSEDIEDDDQNGLNGKGQQMRSGPVDGNWTKGERRQYAQANNLRPRYGLPAGGFDSSRRAPPIYEAPERERGNMPEVTGRDLTISRDAQREPNAKSRSRTTYWDPARSTD